MSLRNAKPYTFKPKGACDCVDGTNAFPGAMVSLANLVPAPNNLSMFAPRPASQEVTNFSSFITPEQIECCLVVGNLVYGMIASSHYSGKSEPFCYNLATSSFISITGVTSALLPTTQSTTGDWQPPHMEPVGSKIIVTHPGFSGGSNPFFGWLDLTGASITTLVGNTSSGSNVITSISGDGTSSPILDGVQPGQLITGTDIPANAYVVSVANGTFDTSTTGSTHGNTTLDSVPSGVWATLQVGMYVLAADIAKGTYISALPSSGTVTLSAAASGSNAGETVNFSGGGTITISANCTGNSTLTALTISGGTAAAPLWGAGNTNVNPLIAVPAWCSQYNGRAWYAVGNVEVFSDSLNPLNVTNASQAITIDDATPITCSIGLPLQNMVIGGIVQSLIVVKGGSYMSQITGDQATSNLSNNALNMAIGTLAPNTLCATPLGIGFIAPDGFRIINFQATVGEPIGANGTGINVPFLNALYPSRMCAAYNQNTLRVSVQNSAVGGSPWQEWWYNFTLKAWTGPHSFPAAQIKPCFYNDLGFILMAEGINAALWSSSAVVTESSEYTENGNALSWTYQTALLPDNNDMAMNAIVQSSIGMQIPGGTSITVQSLNEVGLNLDTVSINSGPASTMTWGSSTWGSPTNWGSSMGYFQQWLVNWTQPLVFKQMSVVVTGPSEQGLLIGNTYLKYQILGYFLDVQTAIVKPVQAPLYITTEGGVDITTESGEKIVTEGLPG